MEKEGEAKKLLEKIISDKCPHLLFTKFAETMYCGLELDNPDFASESCLTTEHLCCEVFQLHFGLMT